MCHEADHRRPSGAEIKKAWSYASCASASRSGMFELTGAFSYDTWQPYAFLVFVFVMLCGTEYMFLVDTLKLLVRVSTTQNTVSFRP